MNVLVMCAVNFFFKTDRFSEAVVALQMKMWYARPAEEHKNAKKFIMSIERKGINWNKKLTTGSSHDRQSDREAESIWNL